MIFKTDFLYNYIKEAPLPLAIERTFECKILARQEFIHPILDIGCGEGIFAYVLFNENIDVGIDPDKKELKRALNYGMYKELINCFGDNIDKPDKFFKTILKFHHVVNGFKALPPCCFCFGSVADEAKTAGRAAK